MTRLDSKINFQTSFNKLKTTIMANDLKVFPMDKINKGNLDQVTGYRNAVSDLLEWLKAETEFNPDKRMVDAVKILEGIDEAGKNITDALNGIKDDIPAGIFGNS